ncbi:MAG: FemAB family XrtA/PEP-CTERM system-associated protein [Pseudomonadota bacterium]
MSELAVHHTDEVSALEPLIVQRADPSMRDAWDEFVAGCEGATFFHQWGWTETVERVLRHPTYYLCAVRGRSIEGVLPLAHVKSFLFGNALISCPFAVYGGVAAHTDEARQSLTNEARVLAHDLGVDYLELRYRDPLPGQSPPEKDLYVTFRKTIEADPDVNLKAIPRKQRAMVRKGIKAGLVGEIDQDTDRFFAQYSESVRNLGTPVMSARWFAGLKETFGDQVEVLTVVHDGAPVCGLMTFYFRDEVLPYYGGGGGAARGLKANDFMYWDLMRRAGEAGYTVFDYGRSKKGTGSYSFKRNWGFEEAPLNYAYFLERAADIPNVSPTNPKYQAFIKIWQRMPLGLSRTVGPVLARYLG